jgi:hypothetical protein
MIPERAETGRPRAMDPAYAGALARQCRKQNRERYPRISIGELIYGVLAILGWIATTLLTAAGCFVVLAFMAGNGSLAGFFGQLNLLAGHYLAAAPASRGEFDINLLMFVAIIVVGTAFFRRAALISIFTRGGSCTGGVA